MAAVIGTAAERVGFEPTWRFSRLSVFETDPLWPLGHLSKRGRSGGEYSNAAERRYLSIIGYFGPVAIHLAATFFDRSSGPAGRAIPPGWRLFAMAHITVSAAVPEQELGDGIVIQILTGDDSGSDSLRVGTATFRPGAGLPCHTHEFDESITILSGTATIFVDGKQRLMGARDTAFVPEGTPHRFANEDPSEPMVMLWVYAAASIERNIVDMALCEVVSE